MEFNDIDLRHVEELDLEYFDLEATMKVDRLITRM